MLIQKVFSDMEKELRESFEGRDMYFGYSNDNYDISVFDIPDITVYYAGTKLRSTMMMILIQCRCNLNA